MVWTADEQLRFWEQEVRDGREARTKYLERRKEMLAAYSEECGMVYQGNQIRLHLLFAFVQSLMPRMLEVLPEVTVRARRAQWSQAGVADQVEQAMRAYARLQEKILRWNLNHPLNALHEEVMLQLMDALISGVGVIWHEWNERLGLPVSRYVEAQDFCIDPRCRGRLEDARWVARAQRMTLSEVRRLWPERVPEGWAPSGGERLAHERENEELLGEKPREWRDAHTPVTVWEVCTHSWDPSDEDIQDATKRGQAPPKGYRRIMWADGLPGFLENGPEPLALGDGRFPVTVLRFNELPGDFWAVPEMSNVRPIQQFVDDAISVEADQARRGAIVKMMVQDAMLDPDEEKKLLSDAAYELIRCQWSGADLPVKQLDINPRPSRMFKLAGELWDLMQNLVGFQELERGALPARGTTATALSIAHEGSQTRVRGKIARLRAALGDTSWTYLQMVRQMWDQPTVLRVAGPAGADWLAGLTSAELFQELVVEVGDQDPSGMRQRQELNDAIALGDKLIPLYQQYGQMRQMQELVNQIVARSQLQNQAELELQLEAPAGQPIGDIESPLALSVAGGLMGPSAMPGPTVGGLPGSGGGAPQLAALAQGLNGRAGIPNAHNAALGPLSGMGPRGMEGLIGAGAPGRM